MADARLIPPGINDVVSQAIAGLCDRFDALDLDGLLSTPVDTRLDAVLEHLAWAYHVDGWEYLTTRAQRIDLISRFFEFHRYKGTVYGLRLYLNTFLGRDLLACSPPTKSFCGASLTDAERAAWSAKMPEIRVYPFRHVGTRGHALFVGECLGLSYPATSDAVLRIGEKVTLYDPVDGSETDLDTFTTFRDTVTHLASRRVTVALPGMAGQAMFAGRCLGASFACDTGAASRYYVLDLVDGYADEVAKRVPLSVRPSLTPVTIGCDTVSSPGTRGRSLFLGHRWPDGWAERAVCFLEGSFPVPSTAKDRIYRRTKLYDASRAQFDRRQTSMFLGACKLGAVRPHYAEAAVDMIRSAPARAAFCGRPLFRLFSCDLASQAWISRMCHIGKMAVRLSDRVLVSTANRHCIQASEAVKCGAAICGAYQIEAF